MVLLCGLCREKGNLSYVDVYKMSDASSDSGEEFLI